MSDEESLVDAGALLSLAAELRELADRLESAAIGDEQRQRWQHTLGAIAEGATGDLERARAQLRRLAATVDRALDRG